jgi:mannose-6-phosphate isomerase-like protein (cupin superfamily)
VRSSRRGPSVLDGAVPRACPGATWAWGEGCDGWRLLDRADLGVIQERIPPGTSEVRHFHSRARQVFFVLEGRLAIVSDRGTFELAAGDSLEIPPTELHRVHNPFERDALFLVISAPTTRGDRTNVT